MRGLKQDYIIEFKRDGLSYGQANAVEIEHLNKQGKFLDEEWNIVKEDDILVRYRNPSTGGTRVISQGELRELKKQKYNKKK